MKYFSADLHLNHANIIRYCSRPCTNENHNEWIYQKFDHLKEGDQLYLLGDVMFKPSRALLKQFFQYFKDKGVELEIVIGNHDESFVFMMYEVYREVFGKSGPSHITHYISIRCRKDEELPFPKIVMSHYPMESWDSAYHGSMMLHGHTHGTAKKRKYRFDVGLDVDHKVYSLDDLIIMYQEDKASTLEGEKGGD